MRSLCSSQDRRDSSKKVQNNNPANDTPKLGQSNPQWAENGKIEIVQ